jgi:hypothetical protein
LADRLRQAIEGKRYDRRFYHHSLLKRDRNQFEERVRFRRLIV